MPGSGDERSFSGRLRVVSRRMTVRAVIAGAIVAAGFFAGVAPGPPTPALARVPTTIGFDVLPAGTLVSNQYDTRGVDFQRGIISNSPSLGIDNPRIVVPPPRCIRVFTRQDLVNALAAGRRCVYVDDRARIDLSAGDTIEVPDGVTLESGRSPTNQGGLLYMSHAVPNNTVMLDLGANTHITGLRLGGFDQFGTSPKNGTNGIRIQGVDGVAVDNNDIYGWPGSAIQVGPTPNGKTAADRVRISGNFIHNNEGTELGYGVTVGGSGYALIERNVFSRNRHDIAGGHSSPTAGYIARLNFVLQAGYLDPGCGCYNGHFDFHGSNDPGHWVGGTAGQYIEIRSNTIRGDQKAHFWKSPRAAFDIRGTPTDKAIFENNVLVHSDEDAAVQVSGVCGFLCDDKQKLKDEHKLFISGNRYNVLTQGELAVGRFAGGGRSDVFQANGTAWWYSPGGSGAWRFLRDSTLRLNQLALGDFNGDGKTDVFTQSGSSWLVSYNGTGSWQTLPAGSNIPMSNYRFGDFDGDHVTDIFRTKLGQWYYSSGGRTAWIPLQTSSLKIDQLRLGDFNGDGKTDVFSLANQQWSISYGGTSSWQRLNKQISSNLGELVFADFNGDGKTDIARSHNSKWEVSWGGATPWQPLQTRTEPSLTGMLLGDFTGDGRADVLRYDGQEQYGLSSGGTGPLVTWSQQDML